MFLLNIFFLVKRMVPWIILRKANVFVKNKSLCCDRMSLILIADINILKQIFIDVQAIQI